MISNAKKRPYPGYFGRAVAGCALIFTFLLLFVLSGYNIMLVTDDFRKSISIQVYFDSGALPHTIINAEKEIWNIPGVSEVEFISSDAALQSLKDAFGEELFTGLKANPLPPGFEVKLDRNSLGWENLERVAQMIKPITGVKEVDYGGELLRRIDIIREFVISIGLIFMLLISFSATAVVSNATQLLYYRDREKIEVMRMLGATNFFIARPLIVQGAATGLVAMICAVLFSLVMYIMVNTSLMEIEFVPPHILSIAFLWVIFWGGYGGYNGFVRGKKLNSSGIG